MPKKLKLEKFVEKSIRIHGDKYGYDKVVYVNNYTKVTIVCSVHGDFLQTPKNHLQGFGCKKCGTEKSAEMFRRSDFVKDAKSVHGDRYDYSLVVYKSCVDNVPIICKKHGVFMQSPKNHLSGSGCSKCYELERTLAYKESKLLEGLGMGNVVTTESFIKKAIQVHGDKYDYSESVYVNSRTRVSIICKKHGRFYQYPFSHTNGNGCPTCGRKKRTLTTKEFISKAKDKHGNTYSYDNTVYKNSSTTVEILCYEHGPFKQVPGNHLNGSGCPKCGYANRSTRKTKARTVKVKKESNPAFTPVVFIKCDKHGNSMQKADKAVLSDGCSKCYLERIKRNNGFFGVI